MTTITYTSAIDSVRHNRRNKLAKNTHWCMVEEMYSPHFLAQGLNNEASALIARGENFEQAIEILVRALELSKWSPNKNSRGDENDTDMEPLCSCEQCSLDACLFPKDEERENHDNEILHRKRSRTGYYHPRRKNKTALKEYEDGEFIYRRPLRVIDSIRKNHYMGSSLTVMILFNLALAHQLLAMSIPNEWPAFEARQATMDKALKLYELCVHAFEEGCVASDAAGLRLKLLVMNNLSQIHKSCGYPKKYRMCQEYMLRALMFVAHGREGGWDYDFEILTPEEIDAIYRTMQSSPVMMGNQVHAGAA